VRIAFFDLDKTVLAVNSGTLWVRREVALGHLSKRVALRAMVWLARYRFGFASAEQMVAEAVEHTRGSSSEELHAQTRAFFEQEVRPTFRPGALDAIERHRAAGDRLVMLTSSSNYLAELAGEALGFDGVLCNRLGVGPDGLHTGSVVGRICFGEGKLVHARAELAAHGGTLAEATFYTDSYSDVSVMDQVGHPVAVNPDVRLHRRAVRRGWPIVDWGEPLRRAA
jgi:HAD superfamily hydrolase (TIGR01490 family)